MPPPLGWSLCVPPDPPPHPPCPHPQGGVCVCPDTVVTNLVGSVACGANISADGQAVGSTYSLAASLCLQFTQQQSLWRAVSAGMQVCMCVCLRACLPVCLRVCMRVCVSVCLTD